MRSLIYLLCMLVMGVPALMMAAIHGLAFFNIMVPIPHKMHVVLMYGGIFMPPLMPEYTHNVAQVALFIVSVRRVILYLYTKELMPSSFVGVQTWIGYLGALGLILGLVVSYVSTFDVFKSVIIPSMYFIAGSFMVTEILSFKHDK